MSISQRVTYAFVLIVNSLRSRVKAVDAKVKAALAAGLPKPSLKRVVSFCSHLQLVFMFFTC
jgi:hypothetical protein